MQRYPILTASQLKPVLVGFRKARGLTQAALAEQLGLTQQAYAKLEANPAGTSVERLMKVLQLLDVTLALHDRSAAPASTPGTEHW